MSEEQFWKSNPRIWKVWEKAHKEKVNEQNFINYVNGYYQLRAIQVALEHGFSETVKSEYYKEPIRIFPMTEEEKEAQQQEELSKIIAFFDNMEKTANDK